MNPMVLMEIKAKIDKFGKEHPKMLPFFKTVSRDALSVGSVLELKATSLDGKEYVSNIRITENDVELINLISSLGQGARM